MSKRLNVPAIEFRNVDVTYKVPEERDIPTLKEWVIRHLKSGLRMHEVRALNDVSFTVQEGETLGVIGPNGAGKSTLLRVAGGIIAPTRGEAVMRGRLAPIIELGTGFEFELSGRENIFFNGALLGRSRKEMVERSDEIVEFAGLADFIDSPLRTYSTGMVARLAFAIATTVDAHILLLDEILSVGDQSFRERCQARIDLFRQRGITIVLVSHDLTAVASLCTHAVWLDHGRIRMMGDPAEVVDSYKAAVAEEAEADIPPALGLAPAELGS